MTDYLKNNEPVEKIKEEYQSDLEQMKSYFVTYYEKVISDNTLNDVEKITDKTKLKACKEKKKNTTANKMPFFQAKSLKN